MATILAVDSSSVEATLATETTWQQALKVAIRDGGELCQRLNLPPELASDRAVADFPVFAPLEYVRRMRAGDCSDPLLRQVLGTAAENVFSDEAALDAVGDAAARRDSGLLQKYDRRVLLMVSGACGVHCRYCFRRHFPYDQLATGKPGWQRAVDEIERDQEIDEVILSGGDPLSVTDGQLAWLVEQLNAIDHVRRIRVHTRFPVVIPQRVCAELLAWVRSSRAAIYFVLHFNHAQEIDAAVAEALRSLRGAGAMLLNQAVLLKGVNDSFAAQRDLCLALIDRQVLPYYLHQLDRVQGTLHFEVADSTARQIVQALREHLPGYGVPKLVREIAGQASKTPVL